jgi:hypothetical protein
MYKYSKNIRKMFAPLAGLTIFVALAMAGCQSSENPKNNSASEPAQTQTQTPEVSSSASPSPADTGLLKAADKWCDVELASIALKQGANPNTTFPVKTFDNNISPLSTSIEVLQVIEDKVSGSLPEQEANAQKMKQSCLKLVELLLDNKADPNLLLPGTSSPPNPEIVGNQAYNFHPSALHNAISQYPVDFTIISLLLKKGADPNLKTVDDGRANGFDVPSGTTPLMFLLIRKGKTLAEGLSNYSSEGIRMTSKAKDDDHKTTKKVFDILAPVSKLNEQDSHGQTVLIIAAKSPSDLSSGKVINTGYILSKELLRLGADLSIKDKEGKTASDYALAMGNTELVKLLGK